jgi:hypothetical protein
VPPIPHRWHPETSKPLPHFVSAAGFHAPYQLGKEPPSVLWCCDGRHRLATIVWHLLGRQIATPLAVRWKELSLVPSLWQPCSLQVLTACFCFGSPEECLPYYNCKLRGC